MKEQNLKYDYASLPCFITLLYDKIKYTQIYKMILLAKISPLHKFTVNQKIMLKLDFESKESVLCL